MLLSLLLVTQALGTTVTAPVTAPTISDDGTITVTSTRLPDLAAGEAACRQARCPVRQDVAATVAYASKLFEDGAYVKARQALVGSINRVKHRSGEAPLVVAQLYAATAKLSEHEGDQDLTRFAYERGLGLLRQQLPTSHITRMATEVRFGDWLLSRGDRDGARDRYRAVIAGDNDDARAVAQLRLAQILARTNERSEAASILTGLTAAADPYTRQAAAALLSRLRLGNPAATASAAAINTKAADVPMLISAPPFPRPGQLADPRDNFSQDFRAVSLTDGGKPPTITTSWVDVAYRINPDGSVSDVRVARSSTSRNWAAPLLSYVAGRRYSVTEQGRERVERFTLTADYYVGNGTLIRRRSVAPRFVASLLSDGPLIVEKSPTEA